MLANRSISVLNTCKITTSFPSPKITTLFGRSIVSIPTLSLFALKNCLPVQKGYKIRAFGTISASKAVDRNEGETFLAEENVSWGSLGVSDCLSRALSSVGLSRPSTVQAACIPAILTGADVVVAAETGSGKTHGYLVPLIHKLLSSTVDVTESDADEVKVRKHPRYCLVLCPNVMLCEQVVRMANSLCNVDGEPLLKTAAICGRQGMSVKEPDIIVSTPVAFLNYLYAIDNPDKHRRADFMRDVKYVVFDEADLLLCGSFQNQIVRLINMLRFEEKQLARLQRVNTVSRDTDAGPVPLNSTDSEEESQGDPILDDIEYIDDTSLVEDIEDIDDTSVVDDFETESVVVSEGGNKRDWRRVRKIYRRSKQYVFVAATLPVNGKQTAGGILKRMFPDANWVSGNYLHCQNPRLEQKWVEVTMDTQVDALINAVNDGVKPEMDSASGGVARTMVFVNTVEAAEAVAKILMGAQIRCVRYHRQISPEERAENLVDFQQNGGVFVCTDSAARGLDIPNVSHVIQAEFASSAVDFLHRIGRTARAGQHGLVTSLFTASNRDLVAAVRQAEELDSPVEKAFSRKRGFRNKLKKKAGLTRDGGASSVQRRVPA